MKIFSYMRARARFERQQFTLLPAFFEDEFNKGCRKFFGVSLDNDGNLLSDEQQPTFFAEYLEKQTVPQISTPIVEILKCSIIEKESSPLTNRPTATRIPPLTEEENLTLMALRLAPSPCSTAELTVHTGLSRSDVLKSISRLENLQLVKKLPKEGSAGFNLWKSRV